MRVCQKYRQALSKAIDEDAACRRLAEEIVQRAAQLKNQAVMLAGVHLCAVFQQGHVNDPKAQHHRDL